jgi:hypothetical protein
VVPTRLSYLNTRLEVGPESNDFVCTTFKSDRARVFRAAGLRLLKALNGKVESQSASFPIRGSKRGYRGKLIQ